MDSDPGGVQRECTPAAYFTNRHRLVFRAARPKVMSMTKGLQLKADWAPAGDQPAAIAGLVEGLEDGLAHQTLLGVTGSGKTFTMANVAMKAGRPMLIMAPNKTLAAQLYGEMKEFFPNNAVEYFVSYYDYYQPEAYVPSSDTFIEKDSSMNEHIEQMRLSATKALIERRDTIVVASVSAIYGLGDPSAYFAMMLHLDEGEQIGQRDTAFFIDKRQRFLPAADRARHRQRRQRSTRGNGRTVPLFGVPVRRCQSGGKPARGNRDRALTLAMDQPEPIASNPVHVRIDNGDGGCRRNHRLDRGAARIQNIGPDFRRNAMRRRKGAAQTKRSFYHVAPSSRPAFARPSPFS